MVVARVFAVYRSECAACPETFHLFQDVTHCSLQITCHLLLFTIRQGGESLAKIAVDDGLDWHVVPSVREVITTGQ